MSFIKTCSLYFSIFTAVSGAHELPLEGASRSSPLSLNMTTINSESADKEPTDSLPSSPVSGMEKFSSPPPSPSEEMKTPSLTSSLEPSFTHLQQFHPIFKQHHSEVVRKKKEENKNIILVIDPESLTPQQYISLMIFKAKLGIQFAEGTTTLPSFTHFPRIKQISSQRFPILCLDGGGTRGIIMASILKYIEKKTHKKIHQLFKGLAGSSTGGIIVAGFCFNKPQSSEPYSAEEIVELYKTMASKIFGKYYYSSAYGAYGTQYDNKPAIKAFQEFYGERQLAEALTPFLVTTQNLSQGTPSIFSSKKALENSSNSDINMPVWKAISLATAAATFFDPGVVEGITHGDGGMTNNNPSQIGLVEICKQFHISPQQLSILSLGAGMVTPDPNRSFTNLSGLKWAEILAENIFNGKNQAYLTQGLFDISNEHDLVGNKGSYLRLQPELPKGMDKLAEYSEKFFEKLTTIANQYIEDNKHLLDAFIEENFPED